MKKTAQHSRKPRQTEAKILFTALSIAFTLGAWRALAEKEANSANLEPAGPQPGLVALDRSPLPTLVPPLPEQPGAAAPALSKAQQPERLFLGGAKPPQNRPAPISRTGSSR